MFIQAFGSFCYPRCSRKAHSHNTPRSLSVHTTVSFSIAPPFDYAITPTVESRDNFPASLSFPKQSQHLLPRCRVWRINPPEVPLSWLLARVDNTGTWNYPIISTTILNNHRSSEFAHSSDFSPCLIFHVYFRFDFFLSIYTK